MNYHYHVENKVITQLFSYMGRVVVMILSIYRLKIYYDISTHYKNLFIKTSHFITIFHSYMLKIKDITSQHQQYFKSISF